MKAEGWGEGGGLEGAGLGTGVVGVKHSLSTSALGHLGPENSLLCPVGCAAVPLASTHWAPAASPRVVITRMPPDIAACPLGVEVTQPLVWRDLENTSGVRLDRILAFSCEILGR